MNLLLIGSGGREHALAWALSASPMVSKLYCTPGNAGIAQVAECVAIGAMDLDRLVAFAKEKKIDFVVIGPETPLVAGLWDRLEAAGIKALGPSMAGAVLEGSSALMPAASNRSQSPATSGVSGPITTKSIFFSLAKATSRSRSIAPMATHSATCAIPALPGVQ